MHTYVTTNLYLSDNFAKSQTINDTIWWYVYYILSLLYIFQGVKQMPNYYFKEIWTPLKIINIRFFRDDERYMWIKVGRRARRRIKKNK